MDLNEYRMNLDAEKKEAIEGKIVDIIADALEKGTIIESELPSIAEYVLDAMNAVTSDEDLGVFLTSLAEKWNIFSPLAVQEQGKVQMQKEVQAVSDAAALAKSGNIDEALHLIKNATQ